MFKNLVFQSSNKFAAASDFPSLNVEYISMLFIFKKSLND